MYQTTFVIALNQVLIFENYVTILLLKVVSFIY